MNAEARALGLHDTDIARPTPTSPARIPRRTT
jgi:hypothetical protein